MLFIWNTMKERGTPMVEKRPDVNGNHGEQGKESTLRKTLVEQWRSAAVEIIEYDSGRAYNQGIPYEFVKGIRLIIKGERVMDTCETPWCTATVDALFKDINVDNTRILIRDFGLGIDSNLVFQKLVGLGRGELHIIELNHEIVQMARKWRERRVSMIGTLGREVPATKPAVEIFIHDGDVYEITKQMQERGEKFDIIISDTYPLSEEEEGTNDLLDLETLKKCLMEKGRFSFFAYFKDSSGGLHPTQKDPIIKHFANYAVSEVTVSPPPDDGYLHTPEGNPIRSLPVVVCSNPKT